MNRFLTLLAIAAVAGVMYVAAAPGGLRTAGPSAKVLNTLKKDYAALSKKEKALKTEVDGEAAFIAGCLAGQAIPIGDFGDPNGVTQGYTYEFLSPPAASVATTALDVTSPTDTNAAWFLAVNPATSCTSLINGSSGLKHFSTLKGLHLPAIRQSLRPEPRP